MVNLHKPTPKEDPFKHGLKGRQVGGGSMIFLYDQYSVGVKMGLQFFRVTPDLANNPKKLKIKDLVEIIESGEITDINDMYRIVRTGFYMSPTTKSAFEQYAADKRERMKAEDRLAPTE